ncbi:MAG: DUF3445 domain-containing protein [Bdellovibrionales bacterium]|nr:DUF3445 domain-containing protein [Bdellovibrionales bacterium]
MNEKTNPKYFPIDRGEYVVAPGLRPLGHDFGNGDFDKKVFQITSNFKNFRQNKLECRQERLSKYFCIKDLSAERVNVLSRYLINQYVLEYPNYFSFNGTTLSCLHTGDKIVVDANFDLIEFFHEGEISPPVTDIIDALALQVEEDMALVCRKVEGNTASDHLGLLHLCSPSHWAAEDKIGMNFFDVHVPIPGIEKINRVADKLVETMIYKGPYVRFIWSFVTDQRLNHHPIAPPGIDQAVWKGRSFNNDQATPFYFRIERQVTWGFSHVEAALFTIGVSFLSGQEVKADSHMRSELISALQSMSPESRAYKGVAGCFDELIAWLAN